MASAYKSSVGIRASTFEKNVVFSGNRCIRIFGTVIQCAARSGPLFLSFFVSFIFRHSFGGAIMNTASALSLLESFIFESQASCTMMYTIGVFSSFYLKSKFFQLRHILLGLWWRGGATARHRFGYLVLRLHFSAQHRQLFFWVAMFCCRRCNLWRWRGLVCFQLHFESQQGCTLE